MLINTERFLEIAQRNAIDVIVATTRENILYCTEYWSLNQWTSTGVQIYAILPVEKPLKATLVPPMSDVDLIPEDTSQIGKVLPYGTFFYAAEAENAESRRLRTLALNMPARSSPTEALVSAIKEGGFEDAKIAIDETACPHSLFTDLGKLFPRATIVPANEILGSIRMIKTEDEIGRLRRSAAIAERAIKSALDSATEGRTEKEMQIEFEKTLVSEGARPDFTVLAFAERTAFPNAQPSERELRRGDAIRFDVGCIYRHYHSDVSRMACLRGGNEKLRKYYEAILRGLERGFDVARSGIIASDLYDEIVRTVRDNGIPNFRRHHCGHGIGIEGYELPTISPTSKITLEDGMVLCLETPYYELGWGGVQVEDTIVVRKCGVELLSSSDRSLIML